MNVKKLVVQLIKKHGTCDPFKLAERLGIAVVFEPLGSIHGYYSKSHRTKVIHINEGLSGQRQLSTCAHELGHAIKHANANSAFLKSNTLFPMSRIETEANEFMIELLFSQDREITILEAVEQYGIPEQLLIKKFTH